MKPSTKRPFTPWFADEPVVGEDKHVSFPQEEKELTAKERLEILREEEALRVAEDHKRLREEKDRTKKRSLLGRVLGVVIGTIAVIFVFIAIWGPEDLADEFVPTAVVTFIIGFIVWLSMEDKAGW